METYSPSMYTITFKFLIGLVVSETQYLHLKNVVVAYLYGLLDKDIHIKILNGFIMSKAFCNEPRNDYSIKLQKKILWVEAMWSNVVYYLNEYP